MLHTSVWVYLRIFELIDKNIRNESHYGGLLYDKLYPTAMKHLRRAGTIINKDDFAFFHEEAIAEFPRLNDEEWQWITKVVQKNINDIANAIKKSNDAEQNDIWQFEILELTGFLTKLKN